MQLRSSAAYIQDLYLKPPGPTAIFSSFTMKCFLILTLAVVAVVCEELYSNENDNFDVEALVNDPKQLQAFADCFIDKAACDALSGEFKKDLKEAVEQACKKCTAPQKHIMKRFLQGLKEKKLSEYQAFKAHYDPQNKHLDALESAIANA